MNILYVDMWPGFNPNDNWFSALFKNFFKDKKLNFNSSAEEADIILGATFGNSIKNINNTRAIKIFYTGENQPPNLIDYDYSLSFDFNSMNGRNFRLPHWYLYINWWIDPYFGQAEIMPYHLTQSYYYKEILNRQMFCSIVIGNPVPNRIEVAQKLNKLKPVYGFGTVFNNPHQGSKIALLKNFKYNICFENTISNGYITEKLLEAKVAGCIPIYYGDKSVALDFNHKSFINYLDFHNSDSLCKYIKHLEEHEEEAIAIIEQPLFRLEPTLDNLYRFLNEVFRKRGLI